MAQDENTVGEWVRAFDMFAIVMASPTATRTQRRGAAERKFAAGRAYIDELRNAHLPPPKNLEHELEQLEVALQADPSAF